MMKCPKCGYERTEKDDHFTSSEECPKCGIIYRKWQRVPDSDNMEPISNVNESLSIKKEKPPIQYKSIIYAIIVIVLSIFVKATFFSNDESSRLVSTLPANLPRGMESSACLIRASGNEGTITAAGQLFKPPLHAPVLFKLGFLFTQYDSSTRVPDLKLQVILSEWYGDRPAPTALWISAPTTIPPFTNNNFQADWIDFDVPRLALNSGKLYVAWVTLGGLANQPDACVGIPAMGPRFSMNHVYIDSPYPEGIRVLYKQENPTGDVVQMTKSAWEVGDVGRNLHFRMSFENQHTPSEDGHVSPSHLDEVIQKKTEREILNRKEREQQTRDEMKQQQIEQEKQRQAENERRQIEMETQRQAENERRQIENEKKQEEDKKRQIEKEIQQYESEQKKEQEKNNSQQGAWPHRRFYPRR